MDTLFRRLHGSDFGAANGFGAIELAQGPVVGGAFAQTAQQGAGYTPQGYDPAAARLEEIQTRRDGGAPAMMSPDGASPDVIMGSAVGSDAELADAQRRSAAQDRETAALRAGDRRAAYAARQEYDTAENAARAYPDQARYVGGGTVVLGQGGANTVTGGEYVSPEEASRRSALAQAERERQRQTGTGRYQESEEQRRARLAALGPFAALQRGNAQGGAVGGLLNQLLGGAGSMLGGGGAADLFARAQQAELGARQVADSILSGVNPDLQAIRAQLAEDSARVQATAEHRLLTAQEDFRREVMTRLDEILVAAQVGPGPQRW